MKARKEDEKKRQEREEGTGEGRRHGGGRRRPICHSLAWLKEVNRTDHTETPIAGKISSHTLVSLSPSRTTSNPNPQSQ